MKYFYIILFYFLSSLYFVSAQNSAYKIYTPEDGLAGLQIWNTYEDAKGRIWVGTKKGVSYFDGVSFHSFSQSDGLVHDFVKDFWEGQNGEIYAITEQGITLFEDGKLKESFVSKKQLLLEKTQNNPTTIYFTNTNDSLLESQDKQIVFSLVDKKFSIQKKQKNTSLKDFPIYDYHLNGYVAYYSQDSTKHKHFSDFDKQDYDLIKENYQQNDLFTSSKQKYLIPFQNFQPISLATPKNKYTHSKNLIFLNSDTLVYNDYKNKEQKIFFIPFLKKILITHITADSQGNIWLSTEQGLIKLFNSAIFTYQKSESTPIAPWQIQEDNNRNFVIGSFSNNTFYKLENGKFSLIWKGDNKSYYGSSNTKQDEIVLTRQRGVVLYKNNIFTVLNDSVAPLIHSGCYFISYTDTTSDEIALGGVNRFLVYDKNRKLKVFLLEDKIRAKEKTGKYDYSNVLSIEKINSDTYLLGLNYGYMVYNNENNKIIKIYNYLDSTNTDLSIRAIFSLTKDYKGTIWAGNSNGKHSGLYKFDNQKLTFEQAEKEIVTQTIETIKTVNEGKILLLSQHEKIIAIDLPRYYNKEGNYMFVWDKSNGFEAIEPAQNSLMQDSKGKIWVLTGDEKIINFPISENIFDLPKTEVSTTQIDFFDKENRNWTALDRNYSDTLVFESEIRSLRFAFNSPTQSSAENVIYEYRLKKDNEKWSEWQKIEDFVTLAEMDYADYQMEVVAYYYYDTQKRNGKSIKRYVLKFEPHLYEIWHVQLFALLIFILFLFFLFKYLQNKRELFLSKQEIANKNIQLVNALKNSEQQKIEIAELKRNLEHDLKNDLLIMDTVSSFSLNSLETQEGKEDFLKYQTRLSNIIFTYGIKLSKETKINEKTLQNFCEKICNVHGRDEVLVEVKTNLNYQSVYDTKLLNDVISELIRNAAKHAFPFQIKNPKIELSIQKDKDDFVWVNYHDNGIGKPTNPREDKQGLQSFQDAAVENTFVWKNRDGGGSCINLCLKKSSLNQ